jgi:hypothetical protein
MQQLCYQKGGEGITEGEIVRIECCLGQIFCFPQNSSFTHTILYSLFTCISWSALISQQAIQIKVSSINWDRPKLAHCIKRKSHFFKLVQNNASTCIASMSNITLQVCHHNVLNFENTNTGKCVIQACTASFCPVFKLTQNNDYTFIAIKFQCSCKSINTSTLRKLC